VAPPRRGSARTCEPRLSGSSIKWVVAIVLAGLCAALIVLQLPSSLATSGHLGGAGQEAPASVAHTVGSQAEPSTSQVHPAARNQRAFAAQPSPATSATHACTLSSEAPVLLGDSHHGHAADGPSVGGEQPTILLLSPVKNAAKHIGRFLALLDGLSYPKSRISLGIMDSDSDDKPSAAQRATVRELTASGQLDFDPDSAAWAHTGTLYTLLERLPALRSQFRAVRVFQHNFGVAIQGDRHAVSFQLQRRAALARSRNHLLSSALRDEQWVLWADSDVAEIPTG